MFKRLYVSNLYFTERCLILFLFICKVESISQTLEQISTKNYTENEQNNSRFTSIEHKIDIKPNLSKTQNISNHFFRNKMFSLPFYFSKR